MAADPQPTRLILSISLSAILFASGPAMAKQRVFDSSPDAFGLLIVHVSMRQKELFPIDLSVERGSILSVARSDSASAKPRPIVGKETAGYLVFAIEPGRYRLFSASGQKQVGARTISASARFDADYLVVEVRAGEVAYLGTVDVLCVPRLFSVEDECQTHLESSPEREQIAFQRVANGAKNTVWEERIRRRAREPAHPAGQAQSAAPSKSSLVRLVGYGLNNNIRFLRTSEADSGEWGAHPRIWLELANRTDRALWVLLRLRPPFPDRVCEHRLSLEGRERSRTLCTQDSVLASVDYAVGLAVFADSGFTDTVETSSWSLRLAESGVEEWESIRRSETAKVEPKEHPRSYGFPVGMVSDAAGGAIVAWTHEGGRRAQHVVASGEVDHGWPANGRALGVDEMVADGAGGAIVTWVRGPGGSDSVCVQHLVASGTFDPAWPAEGRVVCTFPGDGYKSGLGIVADGAGGAIAVWLDDRHRATDRSGQGLRHLYAQHVMASGRVDSLWPVGGRAVFPATNSRGEATKRVETGAQGTVVSDGLGGVIVTWEDIGGFMPYTHVYAQHLLPNGTVDSRWPRDGLRLCRGNRQRDPAIVSDGAGGAIVAWEDGRKGMESSDIYAQHVWARGVIDRAWPADGLPVCDAARAQDSHTIVTDGAGGAIITWRDDRAEKAVGSGPVGFGAVYVQHVLAGGRVDPAWPENGRGLLTQEDKQGTPRIVADGAGGAIVIWAETPTPGSVPQTSSIFDAPGNVCAQHVFGSGRIDPVWPAGGLILSAAPHQDLPPMIVADGAGGATVAFTAPDGIEIRRVRVGGQPGPTLVVRH